MFRIAWKVLSTEYMGNGEWSDNRGKLESYIKFYQKDKQTIHWIEELNK
tara:strand:+ start:1120 stop:1266 length:147 start_codon:yes stop_codon:yes gene_type:complete